MASSPQLRGVLTYGLDSTLLDTRRLLLRSAGYQADVVRNAQEVEEVLAKGSHELLVLCHTVPEQERASIVAAVLPSTAIYQVDPLTNPTNFIAKTAELLREQGSTQSTKKHL